MTCRWTDRNSNSTILATGILSLILLSGLLYGGTFVELVALFLNLAGKIIAHNPVVLMGAFAIAYSMGQVSASLYSVALVHYSSGYDATPYLVTAIVSADILLLFQIKDTSSGLG